MKQYELKLFLRATERIRKRIIYGKKKGENQEEEEAEEELKGKIK